MCYFSLCPISLVEKSFFYPGAKIKIKFLYKHISHGLKCEMIIKKLLSLNYPPPHFCDYNCCFIGLVFGFITLL